MGEVISAIPLDDGLPYLQDEEDCLQSELFLTHMNHISVLYVEELPWKVWQSR